MVRGGAEQPRMAAGHDRGARGRALGGGRIGVEEEQAFLGEAIEVRGLDPGTTVGAGMALAPVVGDDEEDIGSGRFGGGEAGEGGAEGGEEQGGAHGSGVTSPKPTPRRHATPQPLGQRKGRATYVVRPSREPQAKLTSWQGRRPSWPEPSCHPSRPASEPGRGRGSSRS